MDRAKAKELLSKAIDPNTAPAALAELRDLIESDTVNIESLTADNTNKSAQMHSARGTTASSSSRPASPMTLPGVNPKRMPTIFSRKKSTQL